AVFGDDLLVPIVAQHPNAAAVVIAVDIGPDQLLEPFAVIDKPARDRAEVGVVVLDDRHEDGRWPARAFRAERVAAFGDAPAVVAAAFDQENLFPKVLADIADPEVSGGAVEAYLPRLPQAVGPNLRPSAGPAHERIILGDAVRLSLVRM